MIDGKKYRLKGDFYHEQFEIGLYIQRLRAAAESRKTPSDLAAALSDANQFRETYRTKRAAYNRKHYTFAQRTGDDNSLGGTSQLIIEEIGSLSPQAIQTLTEDYTAQINRLQSQLANIDIAEISKVKSSIDSFSISIRELQININNQLQKISLDQPSLQKSIQAQIQQAIANQSKKIESGIEMLITEKLDTQKATYMLGGAIVIGLLSLLIALFMAYQTAMNVKTLKAQQQMIQQNSQAITAQISSLNTLRK